MAKFIEVTVRIENADCRIAIAVDKIISVIEVGTHAVITTTELDGEGGNQDFNVTENYTQVISRINES